MLCATYKQCFVLWFLLLLSVQCCLENGYKIQERKRYGLLTLNICCCVFTMTVDRSMNLLISFSFEIINISSCRCLAVSFKSTLEDTITSQIRNLNLDYYLEIFVYDS